MIFFKKSPYFRRCAVTTNVALWWRYSCDPGTAATAVAIDGDTSKQGSRVSQLPTRSDPIVFTRAS